MRSRRTHHHEIGPAGSGDAPPAFGHSKGEIQPSTLPMGAIRAAAVIRARRLWSIVIAVRDRGEEAPVFKTGLVVEAIRL